MWLESGLLKLYIPILKQTAFWGRGEWGRYFFPRLLFLRSICSYVFHFCLQKLDLFSEFQDQLVIEAMINSWGKRPLVSSIFWVDTGIHIPTVKDMDCCYNPFKLLSSLSSWKERRRLCGISLWLLSPESLVGVPSAGKGQGSMKSPRSSGSWLISFVLLPGPL